METEKKDRPRKYRSRKEKKPETLIGLCKKELKKITRALVLKGFLLKVTGIHGHDGVFTISQTSSLAKKGVVKIKVIREDRNIFSGIEKAIDSFVKGNNHLKEMDTNPPEFTITLTFNPSFFDLKEWPADGKFPEKSDILPEKPATEKLETETKHSEEKSEETITDTKSRSLKPLRDALSLILRRQYISDLFSDMKSENYFVAKTVFDSEGKFQSISKASLSEILDLTDRKHQTDD